MFTEWIWTLLRYYIIRKIKKDVSWQKTIKKKIETTPFILISTENKQAAIRLKIMSSIKLVGTNKRHAYIVQNSEIFNMNTYVWHHIWIFRESLTYNIKLEVILSSSWGIRFKMLNLTFSPPQIDISVNYAAGFTTILVLFKSI